MNATMNAPTTAEAAVPDATPPVRDAATSSLIMQIKAAMVKEADAQRRERLAEADAIESSAVAVAVKAAVEKQLQDLCGQLESSTRPDEIDSEFLADGVQHDREKTQQQRSVLGGEL